MWEWLTLCPKTGPLAQISQTFGMVVSLSSRFEPHLYHNSGPEANFPAASLDRRARKRYAFRKAGMKRPLVPLLVLFALFSCGACARHPATTPLNAGVLAAGEERWEEAVQYWKKALEQDPDSAAAHNNLAVACEKRGDLEEAGREYEAALRLDPGNALIKANYESYKARIEGGRGRLP